MIYISNFGSSISEVFSNEHYIFYLKNYPFNRFQTRYFKFLTVLRIANLVYLRKFALSKAKKIEQDQI